MLARARAEYAAAERERRSREPETTYARRLGLFSGTMAVIGGIIGGGIFRTPAAVAERVGSSELILAAWIAGGVVALAGALCFGELGQRRPRAGGGYVYLRETWGPLPAFLYGWALLLVIASGAIAAIAVTFADYTLALTGLPRRFALPLAIAAIVLVSGVNYLGVRPGAVVQNVFTLLKLAALAALVVVGLAAGLPPVGAGAAGRAERLRRGAGAGPVHLRRLAADQFHRGGDGGSRARTAARAAARRRRGGRGLSARQPRLPERARCRGPRRQHRAGGGRDAAHARARRAAPSSPPASPSPRSGS